MKEYEKLLLQNKSWAREKVGYDPDFFNRLSEIQTPKYLWIGCSDSRVPADQITGTEPGEIFVHRNIANLVVNTDLNMLSVLKYAVEVLKVEHVIVCGHYGCGGVLASMGHQDFGFINKWLRNIKDVYRFHEDELTVIEDPKERANKLVELNVKEQVHNLAKTTIIQKAWHDRQGPTLHGWVYSLKNGILNELTMLDHTYKIEDIYRFDF